MAENKLWLVVEWKSVKQQQDIYSLVNSEELVKSPKLQELHTGKVVKVKVNGKVKKASIVIVSEDKLFLEMEIKHLLEAAKMIEGQPATSNLQATAPQNVQVTPKIDVYSQISESGSDFSPSDSDWNPGSNNADSDGDHSITGDRSQQKVNNYKMQHINMQKPITNYLLNKEVARNENLTINPVYSSKKRAKVLHANMTYSNRDSMSMEPPRTYSNDISHHSVRNTPVYATRKRSYGQAMMELPQSEQMHAHNPLQQRLHVPPMTFDQQTQTELANDTRIELLTKNQAALSSEIDYLHKTIDNLRSQIESLQATVNHMQAPNPNDHMNQAHREYVIDEIYDPNFQGQENEGDGAVLRDANRHSNNSPLENAGSPGSALLVQRHTGNTSQLPGHMTLGPSADNSAILATQEDMPDMVPIGSGKTFVPSHIYRQIKWNQYTQATRQLLMAIFPRRTLATHSMTGKSSPAFSGKPAKLQLDARKVADIIMTVTKFCRVHESLVKNIITVKCCDEYKMYKTRQGKMKSKELKKSLNQENHSPESEQS